jgi:hypothetical protein
LTQNLRTWLQDWCALERTPAVDWAAYLAAKERIVALCLQDDAPLDDAEKRFVESCQLAARQQEEAMATEWGETRQAYYRLLQRRRGAKSSAALYGITA